MADLSVSIFDTSIPDDSVGLDPIPSLSVSDLVTTSESLGSVSGWDAVVDDSTVTSETLGYYPDFVNAYEIVTLMMLTYAAISVYDGAVLTDIVSIQPLINVFTKDDVSVVDILTDYPDASTVMEEVAIVILFPFATFLSDLTAVSDSANVVIVRPGGITNEQLIIQSAPDTLKIEIERL